MKNFIVGIDLGSSRICAAIGKVDAAFGLEILGSTTSKSRGIRNGIIVDVDAASSAISKCILKLQSIVNVDIKEVYVALSQQAFKLVFSDGAISVSKESSKIDENEVRRVIESAKLAQIPADEEIIDVLPYEYIVDEYDKIQNPVGMCGSKLEVRAQLAMANTKTVNDIYKCINNAGFKVKGLVLSPIANAEAVIRNKKTCSAIVDTGADKTEISIIDDGKLVYTAEVPLGGNIITNDVALCLKIPYEEAGKLKSKYALYDKVDRGNNIRIKLENNSQHQIEVDLITLNQIICARIDELLEFIQNKLNESSFYGKAEDVILVGSGLSNIKGIENAASKVMDKHVISAAFNNSEKYNSAYFTCIGVLKYISENARNELNQKDEVKEKDEESSHTRRETNKNKSFVNKVKDFLSDFF